MITAVKINEKSIIKDLVTHNLNTARIFEKYRIDYYCRGNRSLITAAEVQKIHLSELISELKIAQSTAEVKSEKFDSWKLVPLSNFIIEKHHTYIRLAIPRIQDLLDKSLISHKETHPHLKTIINLFQSISLELLNHMSKEEKIVFHIINYLEGCKRYNEKPRIRGYGSIKNSINTMEKEHTGSVEIMLEIRRLTMNFVLPADAADILVQLYKELDEFENDLHRHVHLENNILFPKAVKLEEELLKL